MGGLLWLENLIIGLEILKHPALDIDVGKLFPDSRTASELYLLPPFHDDFGFTLGLYACR